MFKILINWLKVPLLYLIAFSLKNASGTVLLMLAVLNAHMQIIWELLSHIRWKLLKISPVGAGSAPVQIWTFEISFFVTGYDLIRKPRLVALIINVILMVLLKEI